jgi:transcriptional regulator with XRE-family HTH domain
MEVSQLQRHESAREQWQAQAQAGMEAWCGDDIDPFRCEKVECEGEGRRGQSGPPSTPRPRLDTLIIENIIPDMEIDPQSSGSADMRLAERLRALRRGQSWSLDELSALSGVSRASLSRIENGEVSPTASVLGRLAGAHRTTISRLLAEIEDDAPALVRRDEQPEWVDPATGLRRRSVSPPSISFDCELLACELPAGVRIDYPLPPRLGLEHHLYLTDGALELTIEGAVYRLHAGDCLRYKLMGPSRFVVTGSRVARYILALR